MLQINIVMVNGLILTYQNNILILLFYKKFHSHIGPASKSRNKGQGNSVIIYIRLIECIDIIFLYYYHHHIHQ